MTIWRYILASLFIVLSTLTYSDLALSDAAKIRAKVALFPVGSFEVTSSELIGTGVKKGEIFNAPELKVPVKTLVTGMSLRDTHMRERLLEKEHPFVLASDIQAKDGTGTATVTIAGIKQKLDFKFKVLDDHTAQAIFKLKLSDFKIQDINYKGVGVEDEVEVQADVPYEAK